MLATAMVYAFEVGACLQFFCFFFVFCFVAFCLDLFFCFALLCFGVWERVCDGFGCLLWAIITVILDQRIEVHATGGMLQADNARETTLIRSTVDGRTIDPNCYSFPQRYRDAYRLELEHFVNVVLGREQLRVGFNVVCILFWLRRPYFVEFDWFLALFDGRVQIQGRDVRSVAIIADAATEALKSGQVVQIKYD